MIDCKRYADEILDSITGYGHLAVISVGDDPASASYIRGKQKDCERVGFGFTHRHFLADADKYDIIGAIWELNCCEDVTGIIVQLPLPAGLDHDEICGHIAATKDVDGFRPDSPYKPCTPEGIVHLLKGELGDLTGKSVTIIGRGKLVGKPLMQMLLDEDMTVAVCHSKTRESDLQKFVTISDAVIVAIGKAKGVDLFTWYDTMVIDCGINRDADGKLCGDVGQCNSSMITPVPGGVGMLTRAMLMRHVERGRA